MEPIMSCPQGLTLSGKMCTVAPILSCPTGYALVNGMCQEESGVQGFGDSMNIPQSDNMQMQFAPGEVAPPPQQPVQMSVSPVSVTESETNRMLRKLGGMIPTLPGEELIPKMQQQQDMIRPASTIPQIQPLASPMPMRPLSPQRRQQRMMMSPLPPPPPMRSPKPSPVRPNSPGGECPSGFSINRMDGMCYGL